MMEKGWIALDVWWTLSDRYCHAKNDTMKLISVALERPKFHVDVSCLNWWKNGMMKNEKDESVKQQ